VTGAQAEGEVSIRQIANLQMPVRMRFSTAGILQHVDKPALRTTSAVANALAIVRNTSNYLRLKRAISAFLAGVKDARVEERLHQFCRCIDGVILSGRGSGRKDFAARTTLFIGAGHDSVMREIYDMRSAVEHLRPAEVEAQRASDLRKQRTRVIERALQAEVVARHCLQRILLSELLRTCYRDDATLGTFWGRTESEQQAIWGPPSEYRMSMDGLVEQQFVDDEDRGLASPPPGVQQ
jgi:hypothetical protein